MEYTIKPYGCLCELEEFTINGIKADYRDFGTKEDRDRGNAEPYGCGDMRFIGYYAPPKETIEKYHITDDEFLVICAKLERAISFGKCGWCI